MRKVMLLTAAPGTGKTTAVQKIINLLGTQNCGGFYTEEIKNNDGQRTGFACITLDGIRARLADVSFESNDRVSRYGIDVKGFEAIAINAVEESLVTNKILIIDEIGPMQYLSDKFKETLNKAIDSENIVVGTIFLDSHPEIDNIKKNEHIELYELTKKNREFLPNEIVAKVEKLLKIIK
jgi:nucleoside-triphosphatase